MRICCVSDLHGHLPEFLPECDLVLLAGDYCPRRGLESQREWLSTEFAPWLDEVGRRAPVVGVAGNHDFLFEQRKDLVPRLRWTYLEDTGTEVEGLSIYGSPWQPRFFDWAFNADEPELRMRWAAIPPGTDILLLHGPPHGLGDFAAFSRIHTGSPSLTERIRAIEPRLVVAGHIHEGYGRYQLGPTIVVNAAQVDENYQPVNTPIVVDL